MPIIRERLTRDGAVITVLVGVSENRRKALARVGLPVPAEVTARAQIDTGSFVTAFMPDVFQRLGITPIGVIPIRTPSTRPGAPCDCAQFDVGVALVSGMTRQLLPSVHAIESTDFHPDEEVQAILGRDILQLCVFRYSGLHGEFELAF